MVKFAKNYTKDKKNREKKRLFCLIFSLLHFSEKMYNTGEYILSWGMISKHLGRFQKEKKGKGRKKRKMGRKKEKLGKRRKKGK